MIAVIGIVSVVNAIFSSVEILLCMQIYCLQHLENDSVAVCILVSSEFSRYRYFSIFYETVIKPSLTQG